MPREYIIGISLGLVAIFALLTLISRLFRRHQIKQRFLMAIYHYGEKSAQRYDLEVFNAIRKYHSNVSEGSDIDEITWKDLNMDEVFTQLNITQTSIGDEFLYHRLHQQTIPTESLNHFEQWVNTASNETHRHIIQKNLARMTKEYLNNLGTFLLFPETFKDIYTRRILINVVLLGLSAVLLTVNFIGFLLIFIIVIGYNLTNYEKLFRDYFFESQSCSYFIDLIETLHELLKHPLPGHEIEYQEMKRHLHAFDSIRKASILYFRSRDEKDVLVRMIKCATYIDFFTYRKFKQTIIQHQESAIALYQWFGEIEIAIATASYRQAIQQSCVPTFTDSKTIRFGNASHVLLDHAVTNSGEFTNGVLVSGSNASGKSTFIKTMAINMILSQSIHTACADSFSFQRSLIYTSMALADNLALSESYYIVEIKSLKRILDATQYNRPIVCFVDEILRGTNTIERIAASSAILNYMVDQNIMGFVATHDIELTEILKEHYDNYHFSEKIDEDTMQFDFILKPGFTTTKNAIALLNHYHYDKLITGNAYEYARLFEKNRSWEIITKE